MCISINDKKNLKWYSYFRNHYGYIFGHIFCTPSRQWRCPSFPPVVKTQAHPPPSRPLLSESTTTSHPLPHPDPLNHEVAADKDHSDTLVGSAQLDSLPPCPSNSYKLNHLLLAVTPTQICSTMKRQRMKTTSGSGWVAVARWLTDSGTVLCSDWGGLLRLRW